MARMRDTRRRPGKLPRRAKILTTLACIFAIVCIGLSIFFKESPRLKDQEVVEFFEPMPWSWLYDQTNPLALDPETLTDKDLAVQLVTPDPWVAATEECEHICGARNLAALATDSE
ncbi:MAG: hypothetical protein GXO58_00895 [Thermodesulfobacteria bacterium]|nr:hypothetical protein [Thermodesulfobacteriota bacterium]